MRSETLLRRFVSLFGIVCAIIAGVHIAIGPAAIPGSVPVNATMDSEDRFYATLFLGFGIGCVWCARNLGARGDILLALMGVFFAGGLARGISWLAVGPPNALFIVLGAIELVLPVVVAFWWRRMTRPPG